MDKKKKTILIACAAVLAAVVVLTVVWTIVADTGVTVRGTTGIQSEHFAVDNAMLAYLMYENMYEKVAANPQLYEERNFDITKPLDKQIFEGSKTWFDYFLEIELSYVKEYLVYAEAAYSNEHGLSDLDYLRIDRKIAELEKAASDAGKPIKEYLAARYGRGINLEDVRRAEEFRILTENEHLSMQESFSYDETQVEKFANNYYQLLLRTDCIFLGVDADTGSLTDEAQIASLREAAHETANGLIDCRNADEFLRNIKTYLDGNFDSVTAAEKYAKVIHKDYSYVPDNRISAWLFSGIRVDGDKTVIKFNDDRYTAIYVVKAAERDESVSRVVRDVYFDDVLHASREETRKAAEDALASFRSTSAGEEAFAALAGKLGEDRKLALKEGLRPDLRKTDGTVWADWAWQDGRKAGDVEIVEDEDGVHLLYFVGDGRLSWQVDAEKYMRARDYDALYEKYAKEVMITYSYRRCTKVPARVL